MGRRSRSRSRSRDRKERRRRSRSRSRDRRDKRRSRTRSRSRDRKRSGFEDPDSTQSTIIAIQQEQLQKQLLAQQLLMQQQAALTGGGALTANKKQREIYVGNLNIGVVNDQMLRELFNGALAHLVPDPIANPPVVSVRLDPSGRFGFVEMRTEELASASMALDKVELVGRSINVGRPKGFVEPAGGVLAPKLGLATLLAAQLANQPTNVLLLENMMPARTLLDSTERKDLQEDVEEEVRRYCKVVGVCVPCPPDYVGSLEGGRCYIRFETPKDSAVAREIFNNRTFDGNITKATFVSEEDWEQATRGEWLPPKPDVPALPTPGSIPAVPGIMPAFRV